jgi:two-component system phosphate regulon sensor histidine kinase PhoR
MRSLHFRTRLLLSFWLILIPAVCVPAYAIFQTLEQDIRTETKTNAFRKLELARWMVHQKAPFDDPQTMNQWISELGEKLDHRITIIAADGRVVADSAMPYPEIPEMENHLYREEIMDARKEGMGESIRYSTTVRRKLIYAAKPLMTPGFDEAFIRVAIPVSDIEARLSFYANRFWMSLAAIFLLTLAVSFLLAKRLEKPINKVIQASREIGEGNYAKRLDIDQGPEFEALSTCINQMADKIQYNIDMITAQKQEIEAVFEGMREGVMLLDQNGRIKTTNQALTRIARCVPSCVGYRPMEVFLNPEIQTACNEALSGRQPKSLRVPIDSDTVYEVNLVKIPDGGAVAVFHDISELIRLERVRQDFVANVSHELRTPLTSIKGYAETLMDPNLRASKEAETFVQTVLKNANHMSNIVNDLLELTKQQQKQQEPIELTPVDARECFHAAYETCLPLAERKSIRLVNQLEGPLTVDAEFNSLTQIWRNLLDNAIRHSPPETAITIFALDKPDHFVFAVQDEGPGIAQRHQKRIFERFYRVDKERSRASGGTGLGLSICRHAARSMGGDIWVNSPPPGLQRGTVFFFSLYKARRAADPDAPR